MLSLVLTIVIEEYIMPSYDYFCEANGRTVEVRHGINDKLQTWGEVCERAGLELDGVAADSPVNRLISGGSFVSSNALKNPEPACGTGGCSSGMCGLN
jgi:hypothetical protein